MFELIKLILELIKDSITPAAIRKRRRDSDLRRIGTELYLFYMSLNRIIAVGDEIVNELEAFVERYERHHVSESIYAKERRGRPYDDAWRHGRIRGLVRTQALSIGSFHSSLARLAWSLDVVDPKSRRQLELLIGYKVDVLLELVALMRGEENLLLPRVPESDIRNALSNLLGDRARSHDGGLMHAREALVQRLKLVSVHVPAEPNDEQIARLKAVLSTHEPREGLRQIEIVVNTLREAILANFSLSDILLDVKDARIIDEERPEMFSPTFLEERELGE